MLKIIPVKQINDAYCGPATAQMLLNFWGIKKSQKDLARCCHTTRATGTTRNNLVRCFKKFGMHVASNTNGKWSILNTFVNKKNIPVVVNWFYEDWGHYSVVIGLTKKSIWLSESCDGIILKMRWQKFNRVWFGFDDAFPDKKNITANWYGAVFP